jgi:adenylate kinase family enzyme
MTAARDCVAFSPALEAADDLANYWIRQVMLRVRREICWLWRDRSAPPADRVSDSLDRARYHEERQRFFDGDATARYLTGQIATAAPASASGSRGSFTWAASELNMDAVDRFVLALGLISAFDSAAGPAIAACHNDANRTASTLALAQRLWDEPTEVLALADPAHALYRFGLLQTVTDWDAPLRVTDLVARNLLFPESSPTQMLAPPRPGLIATALNEQSRMTALRLRAPAEELRIVPLLIQPGASVLSVLGALSELTGRNILQHHGALTPQNLGAALPLCWLQGADLLLRTGASRLALRLVEPITTYPALPVTVFVEAQDRGAFEGIPDHLLFAPIEPAPLSYGERVECWNRGLGPRAEGLDSAVAETARRFRQDAETIERVAAGLPQARAELTPEAFSAACRATARLEFGDLAQRVSPRFDRASDLFLPPAEFEQFQEVLRGMRAITDVHYRWGTARVWNEGGISVLFAGPPGTGKTMAAEILASELKLPMFRIDLSQVVNKYIGETEKNLKRIFDAADGSDALLLFDEADAIFGKRMEARDAHDRYSNLEISYLLDRMERFKGLAVLSTNRKKDLDEAFLRRLRYVLEFPLPGLVERRRIWQQSIPAAVDASAVDIDFLASRFPIAGGHIRSIVFNACLQSAHRPGPPCLRMEETLVALKREFNKMNRPVGLEAFGPYAALIRGMDGKNEPAN